MLDITGRRKPRATHQAGHVALRPERPRIGSRYVRPVAKWHTEIPPDQLWIQNVYLNQPVSEWTWHGRWSGALRVIVLLALVFIFYHAGRWVPAGMPTGY